VQPVETVLSEIAKDEIDEVDIIMEDITDEIHDLQVRLPDGGQKQTFGIVTFYRRVVILIWFGLLQGKDTKSKLFINIFRSTFPSGLHQY
jgi:hypothetical protein